jgi:hypothetical protein
MLKSLGTSTDAATTVSAGPYADFVHRLRMLSDSGDTVRLNKALHTADERRHVIFEVWLGGPSQSDAYKASIQDAFD